MKIDDETLARAYLDAGQTTQVEVARMFGVSPARVSLAVGRVGGSSRSKRARSRKRVPSRTASQVRSRAKRALGVAARGRGVRDPIAVTLTPEDVVLLTEDDACTYCGGRLPVHGLGLDRIDPILGYEHGNVVPCCRWCNDAKGHLLSHDEYAAAMAVRVARQGRGKAWEGHGWREGKAKEEVQVAVLFDAKKDSTRVFHEKSCCRNHS